MKHGLNEATVRELHRVLARRPEVERAVLYGSRALGTYRPGSDIDLALAGERLDQRILGQIASELEDGWLPYRCDLCLWSAIEHPPLLEHIRRVGIVLYEKEPAFASSSP